MIIGVGNEYIGNEEGENNDELFVQPLPDKQACEQDDHMQLLEAPPPTEDEHYKGDVQYLEYQQESDRHDWQTDRLALNLDNETLNRMLGGVNAKKESCPLLANDAVGGVP